MKQQIEHWNNMVNSGDDFQVFEAIQFAEAALEDLMEEKGYDFLEALALERIIEKGLSAQR